MATVRRSTGSSSRSVAERSPSVHRRAGRWAARRHDCMRCRRRAARRWPGLREGRCSSAGRRAAAARWSECMWPWEHVGSSAADGILDDETYDWIPVVRAMAEARGGADRGDRGPMIRRPTARPKDDGDRRLAHRDCRSCRTARGARTHRVERAGRGDLQRRRRTVVTAMTGPGTVGASRSATWESWVDRQIRDGDRTTATSRPAGQGQAARRHRGRWCRQSARRGLVAEGQAPTRAPQLPADDARGSQGGRGGAPGDRSGLARARRAANRRRHQPANPRREPARCGRPTVDRDAARRGCRRRQMAHAAHLAEPTGR